MQHLITERNRRWWVVIASGLSLLILNVDFWGIAVALPVIGRDFNTTTAMLGWLINAFILLFGAPLIAVGRLGDIVGRRKVLLIGVITFTMASALAALSPNVYVLILARAIQGAGGSLIFANSLAIVTNAFPPEQRGAGIGLWVSIGLVGGAAGPVVAGVITATLGWEYFFWLNVPVGVLSTALILLAVPESRDEEASRRIDWPGFFVIIAAASALVFGIQQSVDLGWASPWVIGSLAGCVLLGVVFVVIERFVPEPLMEFRLFLNRNYVAATAVGTIGNYSLAVVLFFMTLYLQHIQGLDPFQTGLMYLSAALPFVALSFISGRITDALGARLPLVVSMSLYAVACGWLALIGEGTGLVWVGAGMFLTGVAMAISFSASTTAAMLTLPVNKAGAATGVLMMVRHVGNALGVAVTAVIFKAVESRVLLTESGLGRGKLSEVRGLLSGSDAAAAKLKTLVPAAADRIDRIVQDAFDAGLSAGMWSCAALCVVSIVCAALIKKADRSAP